MAVFIFRATQGPISRRPSCPVQCQGPLCRDISQMGFWFARVGAASSCGKSRTL